ncbi:apolipoprotein N-acyltransferase [Brachybacterium endophyticum]|uniref:Apolipoprotein N-acyltransferase n=1 Tax=Brachybacterium endophyticum TaxID=2182385 RepID=A0A2U2RIH9_9MICO|nr:apolipoprotein N-acyltransferase [Brachybacterium endophyticum]PWH05692.1 apolipoprotein N-acyltransferase [Brachybacterium endophyticum]
MSSTTRAVRTDGGGGSVHRRGRGVRDQVVPTTLLPAVVLAVLGGLAAIAAFPPYDLWMLLPFAIAGLNAAVLTRRWQAAALTSLLWGLAFFVPLTIWAKTYAGVGPWLALGAFQALYIVVYGLLARAVLVRRGITLGSGIVVAALWVGVETLRSTVPWGGLSWGSVSFALSSSPLLNLGPWIGTAGLSFVVALLGQFLCGGILALLGRRHRGVTGLSGVWPMATVIGVVIGTMVVPMPKNPPPTGDSTLTVAGVQGNMDRIDPESLEMPDIFPHQLEATDAATSRVAGNGGSLDLVVWPEDSTGWDPRKDPARGQAITSEAQKADAPIILGTQTPTDDGGRYNNSLLWTQQGEVDGVYAKRHPVPFGEYIPYRSFFRTLSDKVDLISSDMKAGKEPGVFDVDGHGVGILICFEIAYQDLVHDVVDDGAQVIVVQSNNALFGDSDEAIQQVAEAKVFAVVSGRSVVHVSTVGQSAIFTPEGRTLDYQDHWTQGSVVADVPLRTGITPAVAAGHWPEIVLSGLGLAGVLLAGAGGRRAVAPARRRRDRAAATAAGGRG